MRQPWNALSQLACSRFLRFFEAVNQSRTGPGTWNGVRSAQPRLALVAASSVSPSGLPCTPAVSTLFGLPQPMWVRQMMIVGRRSSPSAAFSAARIEWWSWPSACSTRQPSAAKRWATSSEKASPTSPSMVILLSS